MKIEDKGIEKYHLTEIDIFNLHLECQNQDSLVGYYGRKLADAKLKHERAKTARDLFEAETARRIRRKPQVYNLKRLTEGAIKEVITVEVLTSDAHEKVLKTKHTLDILEITLRRLEHRKRALSDLVYLQGQNYFAAPSVPKRLRDKMKGDREKNLYRDED